MLASCLPRVVWWAVVVSNRLALAVHAESDTCTRQSNQHAQPVALALLQHLKQRTPSKNAVLEETLSAPSSTGVGREAAALISTGTALQSSGEQSLDHLVAEVDNWILDQPSLDQASLDLEAAGALMPTASVSDQSAQPLVERLPGRKDSQPPVKLSFTSLQKQPQSEQQNGFGALVSRPNEHGGIGLPQSTVQAFEKKEARNDQAAKGKDTANIHHWLLTQKVEETKVHKKIKARHHDHHHHQAEELSREGGGVFQQVGRAVSQMTILDVAAFAGAGVAMFMGLAFADIL